MSEENKPDNILIGTGPRSWREATQILRDATARLLALNPTQSNSRGVKPLMPARSKQTGLKFIDFGVARFLDGNAAADFIAGVRIGSAAYMSPERCRGQQVDARSDLYALTCCYYEMLTGERPFQADDAATTQYEHCYTPFPDPASKVPGLPDGVRQVLARGSDKDPANRYQSAAELVADLTTLLESGTAGKPRAARRLYADMPVGSAILAGKPSLRSFIVRTMVYSFLAALIVGAGIALYKFRDLWDRPSPPAEPVKPPVAQPPPRHVPPSLPATTRAAATFEPARSTPAPSLTENLIPIRQPRDVAAYLLDLGILDKPLFERGEKLRTFKFTRLIPQDEWPTVLAQMNDVEYVLFRNQSGTDEAVSYVAKAPLLQRLSLDGEPVTDKGCAFLNGHPSLQRLDLPNTAISEAAIPGIASIPNLTALDLRKTAVHGACWKPLQQSRVSSLWIGDNAIEDADLADLAGHWSLSMVQLSNTHVTNAVIDTLASMPNFRQGDFADTRIDDTGAAKLGRMQNLVTLELSGCPIGENGLLALANLKNLRRLQIRNLPLSDPALERIAQCAKLETLDLAGCSFNASGLRTLSRLSVLRSLRLAGAKIMSAGGPATTRQMLDSLKRKLPNLLIEGTPLDDAAR